MPMTGDIMGIIEKAVKELEERLEGSGCEDGVVTLYVDPDLKICQFERGACMVAVYGGKSAEFVTHDPTRAKTKISFMFGTTFETEAIKAAACAIINAVTGFLCISRILRSCNPQYHVPCLNELKGRIKGKKVYIMGMSPGLRSVISSQLVATIEEADILLVTGEGITSDSDGSLNEKEGPNKEILFIGPSVSGIASINREPLWCPYGRG
jgi:hypothetical protein